MSTIRIADKPTLDNIKTDTTNIGTKLNTIETKIDNIASQSGGGSFVKLADVTNVSISTGSDASSLYNTLNWKDPDDVIITGTSGQGTFAEWDGTIIVRKKDSAPNSPSDGIVILNSKVRNQYQTTGYTDRYQLEEETTYYYRFFPYTVSGVITQGQYTNIATQFEYVSWATSSWSAIQTAIERHRAGLINVKTDYGWKAGDYREITLNAVPQASVYDTNYSISRSYDAVSANTVKLYLSATEPDHGPYINYSHAGSYDYTPIFYVWIADSNLNINMLPGYNYNTEIFKYDYVNYNNKDAHINSLSSGAKTRYDELTANGLNLENTDRNWCAYFSASYDKDSMFFKYDKSIHVHSNSSFSYLMNIYYNEAFPTILKNIILPKKNIQYKTSVTGPDYYGNFTWTYDTVASVPLGYSISYPNDTTLNTENSATPNGCFRAVRKLTNYSDYNFFKPGISQGNGGISAPADSKKEYIHIGFAI